MLCLKFQAWHAYVFNDLIQVFVTLTADPVILLLWLVLLVVVFQVLHHQQVSDLFCDPLLSFQFFYNSWSTLCT